MFQSRGRLRLIRVNMRIALDEGMVGMKRGKCEPDVSVNVITFKFLKKYISN